MLNPNFFHSLQLLSDLQLEQTKQKTGRKTQWIVNLILSCHNSWFENFEMIHKITTVLCNSDWIGSADIRSPVAPLKFVLFVPCALESTMLLAYTKKKIISLIHLKLNSNKPMINHTFCGGTCACCFGSRIFFSFVESEFFSLIPATFEPSVGTT